MKNLAYLTLAVISLMGANCTLTEPKVEKPTGLSTGYPTPGFDTSYYAKALKPNNPAKVRVKVSTSNQAGKQCKFWMPHYHFRRGKPTTRRHDS